MRAPLKRIGLVVLALLAACGPAEEGDETTVEAGGESLSGAQKAGSTLVTTGDVNLREGPSTDEDLVAVLKTGTEVTLLESNPVNGFYRVKSGSKTGYCSGKYLKTGASGGGTTSSGGPSASDILDALGNDCDEITNGRLAENDGGTKKVAVCRTAGAVYWTSDLDVDCDGISSSVCSKQTDGSYQSQTAATDSSGRYLNAATLPYVVLPLPSSRFDYKDAGLALGSVVAVIYQGKVSYGIVGDLGPTNVIGEASYAMAKSLGMDPSPSHGGAESGVTYVAFTGTSARVSKKESHDEAVSIGQAKANALVDR